jgi:electron transport complex protein RnfB
LAALTGLPAKPISPVHGLEGPRTVAFIDETWCIGCTLCIKVCPVDAIMGANKLMHSVLESYCTGCELCLPVCPVDCIELENVTGTATGWAAWSPALADQAHQRYDFYGFKSKRDKLENAKRLEAKAELKLSDLPAHSQHTDPLVLDKKRAVIEAALARARLQRTGQA